MPLVAGTFYKFQIQARNEVGFSELSEAVNYYAAQVPDEPVAPTTTVSGNNVFVDWDKPNEQGATIQGYRVLILSSDVVTYLYNLVNCDGSSAAVISTTSCTIPITDLISEPFNLPWGSSIWVKVQAFNSYGDSFFSQPGNGAIILTEPDAPHSLYEETLYRTANQLQIAWTAGAADGGTPVINYKVSYD